MLKKYLVFTVVIAISLAGCRDKSYKRIETDLNGKWEVASSASFNEMPVAYSSAITIPGLVDMASPAIDTQDTIYENKVYWYRRRFSLKYLNSDIIRLKINKSCYHIIVYINGNLAGENYYSFTPSVFDIKPFIRRKGMDNEIVIGVGCRNNLPDTVTNGWDFEKIKYIPGIYDDVKIIQADYPFINNVQIVPDINNKQIRAVGEIMTRKRVRVGINYQVRQSVSKISTAKGRARLRIGGSKSVSVVDMIIPMEGVKLWSPEDPFLYELQLSTTGDEVTSTFGMRSFHASPDSGIFLLNGKPYYMRGTNVCIYRFFEDPGRNDLPWNSEWVIKLHSRFRDMNWNSIRYCIGFPPERWYEIADSLGFLIQDEYPLWTLGKENFSKYLGNINSKQLAAEYTEWMRERWNHPCVVIWDAQNESITDTTGKAIRIVRDLDLSNRPWDNGWAVPVAPADAIESHPYLFSRYQRQKPSREGYLKELLSVRRIPGNDPNSHYPLPDGKRYENPIILNEYGWIWLNRDGSTTTLTDNVYKNVFPEADTPEKRLETYAKNLGILTEYWRASRSAAAVMHFCGLGYSRTERPRGQTSDNFTDLTNLEFEPNFYRYVKQAFSPVGIMVDYWEQAARKGSEINFPVSIINDTYEGFSDSLKVSIKYNNVVMKDKSLPVTIAGLGKEVFTFPFGLPRDIGKYQIEAAIQYKGETIKSIREIVIR